MSIRLGTIVMGGGWGSLPFMKYEWVSQPCTRWLDYHGAVLISYNSINVVYGKIGTMGLTQEEELSAIEDDTPKKREIR